MGDNKPTAGPWRLTPMLHIKASSCAHDNCPDHPVQNTGCELYGAGSVWIGSVHGEHCKVPASEIESNARLLRAAPEMYELLDRIRQACHRIEPWNSDDGGVIRDIGISERDIDAIRQLVDVIEGYTGDMSVMDRADWKAEQL